MSASCPDSTSTLFTAFEYAFVSPQRLQAGVDSIFERLAPNNMAPGAAQCVFNLADNCLFTASVSQLTWQTLSLSHWKEHEADYIDISSLITGQLGVKKFKRAILKIVAYIPTGMTHAEMSRLMFGSYAVPRDALAPIFGDVDDPVVKFCGKRGGLDYRITLTAMTKADITLTFWHTPNIDLFRSDRTQNDPAREQCNRISANDAFCIDVDFLQAYFPQQQLKGFLTSARSEAESLIAGSVDYLRAQPSTRR